MSPTGLKLRIGAFLVAAAALFVGSLLFFGLTDVFEKKARFVSFFSESVRGLNEGSRVRFRGVQIGEVTAVRLSLGDQSTGNGIPVIYEIDVTRVRNKLGLTVDLSSEETYRNALRDGLTAKLDNESILTGQLYVDLNFRPGPKDHKPWILKDGLKVIPTVPSLLSNVTDEATKIIDNVSKIDFPGLSKNLDKLLVRLDKTLADLDLKKTTENLDGTLAAVRSLVESGEVRKLADRVGGAADAIRDLGTDLADGKGAIGKPLAASLADLSRTLDSIESASVSVERLMESGTGPVAQVERTLTQLQRTTESFQSFLEFLRRHPNALIFGKEP